MAEATEVTTLRENGDEKRRKSMDESFGQRRYAVRKRAVQGMVDISLLLANFSQLKSVLDQGASYDYYLFLVVIISLSIALQVFTGLLLIWLVAREKIAKTNRRTDGLNTLTTAMILLIMVDNALISAFGISPPKAVVSD